MKEAPPIVEMRWGEQAHGEGTGNVGKRGNKTYFPHQKREGGDGNGSHQGRMCCYLATHTSDIRHYVCQQQASFGSSTETECQLLWTTKGDRRPTYVPVELAKKHAVINASSFSSDFMHIRTFTIKTLKDFRAFPHGKLYPFL